ncbi:MAG TPA: hypothetical protein DD979_09495, partial [Gammaproteobacteria bacterium]|nr:hypothetical protein [Gammaproteobacteria bacterium]
MAERDNNPAESGSHTTQALADTPRWQKPHTWPELVGLLLIAGIAMFVILSIQSIASDLDSFDRTASAQNTIQLERLQLRLTSVRKIMQLGMINNEPSTLSVAHNEVRTLQQQLDKLLPEKFLVAQTANIQASLVLLRDKITQELIQVESLLRTGANGFAKDSAPVLRLIVRKLDTLSDQTQQAIRQTALKQSENAQAQHKLLKDFSEYSTLFLTIFGLFAAGLLGLALYQRQLFHAQLNANQQADMQTRRLHDTIEGFSTACALYDEQGLLQVYNTALAQLVPDISQRIAQPLDANAVLSLLAHGPETHGNDLSVSPDRLDQEACDEGYTLTDYQGRQLQIRERPAHDGGMIVVYRDVSYIHHAESRLKYLDSHDKLTQLPNRNRFLEDLATAIDSAGKRERIAVVIFDVHNFRDVNETYGHTMGDNVLRNIASTIQNGLLPHKYAARIGGDEFASIINDAKDHASVYRLVRRTLKQLCTGYCIDNIDIPIQASVGIAYYPHHGRTVTGLVSNADAASVHARENAYTKPGVYNNKLKHRTERRRQIERHMHAAIDHNELRVQYQPQIDVRSGMTTGMEALLRWNNRQLGEISPAEFIPLAEDNGMIMELGEWVLKRSINDYQQLARYGMSPGVLSVNLSRRQFNSTHIAATLEKAIADAGLTPQQLTLEITETAIMDDTNRTAQILNELKEMGVGLSIDDF